jgi:diacylglycerol kinase (ATP)
VTSVEAVVRQTSPTSTLRATQCHVPVMPRTFRCNVPTIVLRGIVVMPGESMLCKADAATRGRREVGVDAADESESPHKGQRGVRRIFNAFFYSLSGLRLAFDHESAFRQEIFIAVVLIPLACIAPVTAAERVLLIGSVVVLLIVELLNSSVEAAIDRIGLDTHRLSKRAKDLGSAAVFLALVFVAITWVAIAGPSARELFRVSTTSR